MRYAHWTQVKNWRWKDFTPQEIASRGDGGILVNEAALDTLQRARDLSGMPFVINSAYRDDLHNAMVGGSPRSFHLEGRAFDISLRGHNKTKLVNILEKAGFTGLGVNYQTFIHADTGPKRRW